MTKTEIAEAFSKREFRKAYEFVSENAQWIVIEDDNFIGSKQLLTIVSKLVNTLNP